jgi:predicted ATPase
MLYEIVTGELPYTADSPLSVISQHINAPVKPPSQIASQIPVELDDLIVRLMSKSPGDRPASAQEVENFLRGYLHVEGDFDPEDISSSVKLEIKHNLPAQLTSFVGREEEIEEISQLIGQDSCRLLTLVGPGGIGKTRLAIEVAAHTLEVYSDGVYFISLAPISTPDFILPAIAQAMDFSLQTHGSEDPRNQLLDYLAKRNTLLVLDNYEHLVDGTGILIELLKHAPSVKLMVTSRQRLNLRGEQIFNVPGLTFPENGSSDGDIESSAFELFIERARLSDSRFSVEGDDEQHVIHICQMVEGIPLGIELASAWVSMLSPQEIGIEIEKNLDFLASSMQDLPEKHRSMRAAFDYSWELLSEEQRLVFRKLSVFRGGFSRQAAAEVAGAGLLDLSVLVDKSFLRRDEGDRYEIHELLRQYGEQKLQEDPDEFGEIGGHHSEYYLEYLDQRQRGFVGEGQLEAREEIQTEIENIRTAIHWGIIGGNERGVRSALEILSDFYFIQGYYEGVESYKNIARIIEDQYQPGFDPSRPGSLMYLTALTFQVFFLSMLGSIEVSDELGQNILPVLRKLEISQELRICLMSLGINCAFRGEYDNAEQYLKEAKLIGEQMQDWIGIIGCNIWLGWVYYELGDHESALQEWEEGQNISLEKKNRLMLAFVQSKLALLGEETGDYENAIKIQLEARENFKLFGDQVGVGYATSRLTLSLMGIGEYREAKRFGQESYQSFKEMNHRWGIPASLCRIGFAEVALGENQDAWAHLTEALNLAQKGQISTLVLYSLIGLGMLLSRVKQVEQGVEILSFVFANPITPSLYREMAEKNLTELEGELPQDKFTAAKEAGENSELEEIVNALPDDLTEPETV